VVIRDLGALVGDLVGINVAAIVGLSVKDPSDGSKLHLGDGAIVGELVGTDVALVGSTLGREDGVLVGNLVGTNVTIVGRSVKDLPVGSKLLLGDAVIVGAAEGSGQVLLPK